MPVTLGNETQTETPASSGLCQQPQARPLAHPRQRGKQPLVPKQQHLAFSRRPDYMPRGRPPHTNPMQCSPWVAVTITVYSLVKRAASRPLWPNPVSGDVLEQNRMAARQVPADPLGRASASAHQVWMLTQSSPPSTLRGAMLKRVAPSLYHVSNCIPDRMALPVQPSQTHLAVRFVL